jgi:hypothetical protein
MIDELPDYIERLPPHVELPADVFIWGMGPKGSIDFRVTLKRRSWGSVLNRGDTFSASAAAETDSTASRRCTEDNAMKHSLKFFRLIWAARDRERRRRERLLFGLPYARKHETGASNLETSREAFKEKANDRHDGQAAIRD